MSLDRVGAIRELAPGAGRPQCRVELVQAGGKVRMGPLLEVVHELLGNDVYVKAGSTGRPRARGNPRSGTHITMFIDFCIRVLHPFQLRT